MVVEGEWTKVNIGIGRQRAEFNFGFSLTYIDEAAPFSAGVAVDDVTLFECAVPPPEPECGWGTSEKYSIFFKNIFSGDQFHCTTKQGCVAAAKTCDLADDCGDFSDEQLPECEQFTMMSFEDADQPFGFFVQTSETAQFQWSRGTLILLILLLVVLCNDPSVKLYNHGEGPY